MGNLHVPAYRHTHDIHFLKATFGWSLCKKKSMSIFGKIINFNEYFVVGKSKYLSGTYGSLGQSPCACVLSILRATRCLEAPLNTLTR